MRNKEGIDLFCRYKTFIINFYNVIQFDNLTYFQLEISIHSLIIFNTFGNIFFAISKLIRSDKTTKNESNKLEANIKEIRTKINKLSEVISQNI